MVKAEALHEGFWKQWFSGHDDDQLKDFREKLQGKIKTEGDRKKLLDEIDDAIDNANRITGDNNVRRWFTTVGLTMLTGIIPLVKLIARLSNADQRKAFRESLYKLRSEVVALKLEDKSAILTSPCVETYFRRCYESHPWPGMASSARARPSGRCGLSSTCGA